MPDDKNKTERIMPQGDQLPMPGYNEQQETSPWGSGPMPPGPDEAEAQAVQHGDLMGQIVLGQYQTPQEKQPNQQAGPSAPSQTAPQAQQPPAITPMQSDITTLSVNQMMKGAEALQGRNEKDAMTFAGGVDQINETATAKAESNYWSDNAGNLTQIALAAMLGTIGAATKNIAYFPFARALGGLGNKGIRNWYLEQAQEREARFEGLMTGKDAAVKNDNKSWGDSLETTQTNLKGKSSK